MFCPKSSTVLPEGVVIRFAFGRSCSVTETLLDAAGVTGWFVTFAFP